MANASPMYSRTESCRPETGLLSLSAGSHSSARDHLCVRPGAKSRSSKRPQTTRNAAGLNKPSLVGLGTHSAGDLAKLDRSRGVLFRSLPRRSWANLQREGFCSQKGYQNRVRKLECCANPSQGPPTSQAPPHCDADLSEPVSYSGEQKLQVEGESGSSGLYGANPKVNPNLESGWLVAAGLESAPERLLQTQLANGRERGQKTGEYLFRSLALACVVTLVSTVVSNLFPPAAIAADPPRRNKLRDQRLAWEKSAKRSGVSEKGGQILGGFVKVSEQPEGPAKVDIDVGKGATYVRRKLYKARYFSEEAIEEFRDRLRRSQQIRRRPLNYFQRNREVTSAVQLGLFIIVLVVIWRWLSGLAKRNRWGWAEWYKPRAPQVGTKVRDRSLGGREVAVGNQWEWPSWLWGGEDRKFRRQTLGGVRKGAGSIETVKHANPLDYEVDLRSEKELRLARLRQEERKAALERRRQVEELPGWWPRETLLPPVKVSKERREVGRAEAQQLLQRLVNMRVVGRDPSLEDITSLHETCQRYGVSVTFDVTSTQESIYRVALQHKVGQLMSAARYDVIDLSLRPAAARFVGLLAGDLGIPPRRAVDLVESFVAAKTKASLTQAYALLKQERTKELRQELAGLAIVLSTFPLPLDSAKLELVGDGLSARISSKEREALLGDMCSVIKTKLSSLSVDSVKTSTGGVEEIAARALGLTLS